MSDASADTSDPDEMRPHYDFDDAEVGKYYERYREAEAAGDHAGGLRLDPDLREQFPTSADVNTALRRYQQLLAEQRRTG